MPRKTQPHQNSHTHADGKRESIINDSAREGGQMGIYFASENQQEQNPFHLSQSKPNKDMKEFEKLMRDDEIE
ncbi:hypothetical protein [Bacillus sp. Marseille-Q3570]|uniref:hypothetical protein n=1 Tax=Bacillus sp. Marseille-Q3570 TaxID=2963522 RepID=UPI0021B7C9FB|nr:hypothetical protein [Bacillus sp. Marseille-Q3570]